MFFVFNLFVIVFYYFVMLMVNREDRLKGKSMSVIRAVAIVLVSLLPVVNLIVALFYFGKMAMDGTGPTLDDVRFGIARWWKKTFGKKAV